MPDYFLIHHGTFKKFLLMQKLRSHFPPSHVRVRDPEKPLGTLNGFCVRLSEEFAETRCPTLSLPEPANLLKAFQTHK